MNVEYTNKEGLKVKFKTPSCWGKKMAISYVTKKNGSKIKFY